MRQKNKGDPHVRTLHDTLTSADADQRQERPFNDLFEGLPGSPFEEPSDPFAATIALRPPKAGLPIPNMAETIGPETAADAWLIAFRDRRAAFENMQRRLYVEFQALREENSRLTIENRRLKKLAIRYRRLVEEN